MKKYLLVLAACALTTACVEHEKCYEEDVQYVRTEVVETPSCGCQKKEPTCGCQKAPSCGCHKAPSCGCQKAPACGCQKPVAPAPAPVVPVAQPKTVVVVVPARPQPVAQEIVYPEPPKCGCKGKK